MIALGYGPVEIEPGRVVFEGRLDGRAYHPLGVIHGGYAATLLDTVTGCAVHSTLATGEIRDAAGRRCAQASSICLIIPL